MPDGFQTSEFLLKHGFVDRIVPRPELRGELSRIIDYCCR
jgi:acetyl-CoA carboxylase carboxyl transferase subunit beta